jgi:hypothetical protein
MVVHTCHHSYGKSQKIVGLWYRLAWGKKQDPIYKITRAKRAEGMVQGVSRAPE